MTTNESIENGQPEPLKATTTQPLWTVADVANYLRLKPETVRIMARAKKLPALKVGRAWRFRANEIKAMLKHRPATAAARASLVRPAAE